jgi:hypothetical protein
VLGERLERIEELLHGRILAVVNLRSLRSSHAAGCLTVIRSGLPQDSPTEQRQHLSDLSFSS